MGLELTAKNEIELWRTLARATTDYAESSGLELFQAEIGEEPGRNVRADGEPGSADFDPGCADGDRGLSDRCRGSDRRHGSDFLPFLLFDSFPGQPLLRVVNAGGASRGGDSMEGSAPLIPGLSPQQEGAEALVSPASAFCAVMLNLVKRGVAGSLLLICRSSCLLSPAVDGIAELSPLVSRIPFLASQLPSQDSPWHERALAYNRFWIVTAIEAGDWDPIGRRVIIDTRGRAILIRETDAAEPDCQTIMFGEAVGRPVWMRDGIVDAIASRIFSFLSA